MWRTQGRSSPPAPGVSPPFVRDPKIPVDAEYTAKIKEYTTQPFFTSPLVDYLPASKTVPNAEGGARRRRRRARQAALRRRGLTSTCARSRRRARARKVFSIGKTEEGPRDDRGRDRRRTRTWRSSRRIAARLAQARRPAHAEHGRCGRPKRWFSSIDADLLHHRHDSLAGNRLADRADGARLPADRRRPRIHQGDPQQPDHADHAGDRGRRSQQDGGRLQSGIWRTRARTGQDWSTGASTSRTTTTATRWA